MILSLPAVFLGLAAVSGVIAVGGFIWGLAAGLRAHRTEEKSGNSFSGLGRLVRLEGWRRAIPQLLTAGGLIALLAFGALALYASLPSKLFGVAALVIAAYVSITELLAFAKAVRD